MSQRVSLALQTARNRRAALETELAAHIKLCGQCRPRLDVGHIVCDDGWELSKAIQRAITEIRDHEAAQAASHQADMLEALLGEQLPGWVSE